VGTRLWPLSREEHPKELLKFGEHTLLQSTALRLRNLHLHSMDYLGAPILVGNEEYRFILAQQMQEVEIEYGALILEPCGRNTAPAVTLAALSALAENDEALLVIMPSDHLIHDENSFHQALQPAINSAKNGHIAIFGIVPDAPETGYGYIKLPQNITADAFNA